MFKVNNRNTRTSCEICSKLTIMFKVSDENTRTVRRICSKLTLKTTKRIHLRCPGVCSFNFEQFSHIALVIPLLTLNK